MEVNFLLMPSENAFSVYRIGGVKAIESGLLLLGNGADEVLEYFECSAPIAIAWRDRVNAILVNFRPGRRFQQIDWYAEALGADPEWTRANLVADVHAPAAERAIAPQPKRRTDGEQPS